MLWLAGGCAHLPYVGHKVNVSLAGVSIAQVGSIEQIYTFKLRLQNPSAKVLDIKGLSYDVELNGRHFARGVSPHSASIAPYGEVLVDVSAVSSNANIVEQIARLKQDKSKPLRYRLTGNINLPRSIPGWIPFESAGEIAYSVLAPGVEGLDEAAGQ